MRALIIKLQRARRKLLALHPRFDILHALGYGGQIVISFGRDVHVVFDPHPPHALELLDRVPL
eukprot:1176234-Prorocentrum_minimum.AAC.1